ncbi:MAG: YtxH domain-containing protein [Cyclobacteriaceae bacterium]|jgi:gas vesicle protein
MSRKGNNILFGFLAGAAVGAILGILYAPDKGSNTREKLSSRLDKYKKMLEEFIGQMMDRKEETAASPGQPSSPVNRVVTEAQEKAQRLLEDVDDLLAQLRENKKN